jgi:uncharacterized protein YndB with AHSA1/START domain
MENLIVNNAITIQAPVASVWEVLTRPEFIKEWDDIPQSFKEDRLQLGSVIEWDKQVRLTVKEYIPYQHLVLSLYSFSWPLPSSAYDITYSYTLSEHPNEVGLTIEIGDFAPLKDGRSYYEESIKFIKTAAPKIKALAESKQGVSS